MLCRWRFFYSHHKEAALYTITVFKLTLFVIISIEDSGNSLEFWDMECLRTPLGTGAKGVEGDEDRGGGEELRMYKGMTLSWCDSPVSITWLLVRLSEDEGRSVR